MSAISLPKIKSSSVSVVVQIIILQSSFNVVAYMYVVIFSCYSSSLLFQRVYGTLTVLASLESYRWGCVMEACGFIPILWYVEHNLDEKLVPSPYSQ